MPHKCDGCRYKGEHQEMGFRPFGVCFKETNLIKAEQNYNAECCPYIVELYANGTAEELNKVPNYMRDYTETEDFKKAVEAIQCVVQAITETLTPVFKKAFEVFKELYDVLLQRLPNKRILYLAVYHPKERVRKKNMHRIMRVIERGNRK